MYTAEEYKRFAREYGLGELTTIELDYIIAQDTYNYYAAGPSISFSMAEDVGNAWREFKAVATPERIASIQRFLAYLSGEAD